MPWINRYNTLYLLKYFRSIPQTGVILPGIVGCGKTALIENLCDLLAKQDHYDILRFEGDDVSFRSEVRSDSRCILNHIASKKLKKPLVFVDEVQKEPYIFDAIKMAFDKANALFIVSGSNPAFLRTVASDRLQRRGIIVTQLPLALSEIALTEKWISDEDADYFPILLQREKQLSNVALPNISLPDGLKQIVHRFLCVGGLPEAYLAPDLNRSLQLIRLVSERGITDSFQGTQAVYDEVRRYLAIVNSQEFAYQGLHQKLRTSKRRDVDKVLDHLRNHGYLLKKTPYLGDEELIRKTYLVNYSWIDPGLVSYYCGDPDPSDQDKGFRLEAYVHARLFHHLEKIPLKSQIFYWKPFSIKPSTDAIQFGKREIDFLVRIGRRLIPIEVKLAFKRQDIDTSLLKDYVANENLPYGIILYGGEPYINFSEKIIFYPYWAL